jgi:hypothetical protein
MSTTDMSGVSTQDISGAHVSTSAPEPQPQPDVIQSQEHRTHSEPANVLQDVSGVVFSNGCPPWRQ